MKKLIIGLLILILPQIVRGQDQIITVQQDTIHCRIVTISSAHQYEQKARNGYLAIPVDAKWAANVCFGGKDMKTLFITASEYLYGLRMNVKGIK